MENFQYERVSFKANIVEWTGHNTAEICALFDDAQLFGNDYIMVRESDGRIFTLKKGDCIRIGEDGSKKKKSWKECQLTYRKVKDRVPYAYHAPDSNTIVLNNEFNRESFSLFVGWTPLYK